LGYLQYLSLPQLKGLASEFFEEIRKHPVTKDDIDLDTVKENVKWYANIIRNVFDIYEEQFHMPGRTSLEYNNIMNQGGMEEDSFAYAANYASGMKTFLDDMFVRSGAGIVADSVPETEFQESINKAKAVVNALDTSVENF
jgi:hypothetical protein